MSNNTEFKPLPKTPPPGLLMSMAVRYDHGLGCPGYYDQPLLARNGLTHADRLKLALQNMAKIYEEVSGYGFYKPDKEDGYVAMRDDALVSHCVRCGRETKTPARCKVCEQEDELKEKEESNQQQHEH